ncbi:MAG: class I SAM-dependent methyltransferase [Proteobacteria bacterium]|nr:class I SAM-dependent methyltransferase [Pseudomonadota bacterium]
MPLSSLRKTTSPVSQGPPLLTAEVPRRPPLHGVPSTLLIPLAARAAGDAYFPHLACDDAVAARQLRSLNVDVSAYLADRLTVLNILWRTRRIREAGQAFFAQHPQAWGINLGCGLSDYFQWLDNGRNTWIDADLPEVMALRSGLNPPCSPRLRRATLDITHPQWWQALHLPQHALDQPLFVVCEGVLMYLQPSQAQQVLAQFATHAPARSRMLIDTLHQCAVGHAHWHSSVGRTGAEFHWGIRHPNELCASHPRLRLRQLHSVSECYGWFGRGVDALWNPWIGAPLYGLAELVV